MSIGFLLATSLFLAQTAADVKTFTALTNPLPLKPGQITNSYHSIPIPKGPIAIYEFAAEVVEMDSDGNIVSVPSYDAYLHHHVVKSKHEVISEVSISSNASNPNYSPIKQPNRTRSIGFAAGTEARGTPYKFQKPFAFATVWGENDLFANVHIINTRGLNPEKSHLCVECPCSSVDLRANGAMHRSSLSWEMCNAQLLDEGNTACAMESYHGGLRCCEDGEYCFEESDVTGNMEETISTYYLQYTLRYDDVLPETRPLGPAACCDASGNETTKGNTEYDIPQCNINDADDECVHTVSTLQMLHGSGSGPFGIFGKTISDYTEEKMVDVVYLVGHMHRGGLDIRLYIAETDELLCESKPTYGTGDTAGNESGYIVSMSTCELYPPRRMRTTDQVRVVARYDSRKAHTGVMSLFYIAIANVPEQDEPTAKLLPPSPDQHKLTVSEWIVTMLAGVSFVTLLVLFIPALSKIVRRNRYVRVEVASTTLSA